MLPPIVIDPPKTAPTGDQSPYGTILAVQCSGASCEQVTMNGATKTVGKPEDIKYRVAINSATGAGPMVFDEVTPANERTNVKVIAASPGTKVPVIWEGTSVYFCIYEPPYFRDCNA